MQKHEQLHMLTPAERKLIDNYRNTRVDKRDTVVGVSEDYRKRFPIELPRLRLVPTK